MLNAHNWSPHYVGLGLARLLPVCIEVAKGVHDELAWEDAGPLS